VFPSMRSPITAFLKALFFILALPLELAHKHVTMLYNNKYNNGKEEN
jgi:preprotein translocase subunit SecG